MGIDIYLEWEGMTDDDRKNQSAAAWSLEGGRVGYLREAYHGEPYATQILVREAFESDSCKAEIPATTLRARMTQVTEPVYGKTSGHDAAVALGLILEEMAKTNSDTHISGTCRGRGQTSPMTVEEAITERAIKLYDANPGEVGEIKRSFWAFVRLAEKMELETGKPCTIYASY